MTKKREFTLIAFCRDDQKIMLGSRYTTNTELDESLFRVIKRSRNGSRIYGEAMRAGVTPVYGSFKEVC